MGLVSLAPEWEKIGNWNVFVLFSLFSIHDALNLFWFGKIVLGAIKYHNS
jgi:hypothetical protein